VFLFVYLQSRIARFGQIYCDYFGIYYEYAKLLSNHLSNRNKGKKIIVFTLLFVYLCIYWWYKN